MENTTATQPQPPLQQNAGVPQPSRQNILYSLGFNTYENYLNSELWGTIRTRVFERDGHKCISCHSWATQVHHTNYSKDTMTGQDISGLISVCRNCHKMAEFNGKQKTSIYEANRRILPSDRPENTLEFIGKRIIALRSEQNKNFTKEREKVIRRLVNKGTEIKFGKGYKESKSNRPNPFSRTNHNRIKARCRPSTIRRETA